MVNVPPIPPLLCSTPPPIDFGEEDEDVDVLPPTLDGVVDDDFGDFLAVDDTNSNEPLPSPRPPSVCDLPTVSIYDGLVPPSEENLKSQTTIPSSSPPSPPLDNKISKDSKNNTKSINITEAFNFEVKNNYDEETADATAEESKNSSMETKSTEEQQKPANLATETNDSLKPNSQTESPNESNNLTDIPALSKNIKDLTIDPSNVEVKSNANKTNLSCMQNMVSIEDVEDDLSDDELYSPKTPKNFIETDNLNDYFKIEEIKTPTKTGNATKGDSKDIDDKSLDSLDNNESASLGNDNDNEFKSFSSNSFIQNNYDVPPPLQDDTNSIDDDDFGDFADFQDFSTSATPAETQYFVNNTVPVNDINNKQQNNNDLEFNGFNDFNNISKENTNTIVNTNEEALTSVENDTLKDSKVKEEDEFEEFTSHSNILPDSIEENSKLNSSAQEIITQEISQDNNNEDINKVPTTVVNTSEDFNEESKETSHLDNSFGDFNSAAVNNEEDNDIDEDDFGNFAEFSKSAQNFHGESTEKSKECSPDISNDDDDEFDDFADFESHKVKANSEETSYETSTFASNEGHNVPEQNDVEEDDDDDDFGDFNTAQPITPTASSLTLTKTSQNITATTPLPTHNLNDRISKILQVMFTPAITQTADECGDQPKTDKIQDIPFTSIDAAKALEYQWLNSDTRHSFIRALGIDSRNILFGENWNPSLPRFAANLSFNPLKPMKPVQSSSNAADTNSTLEPIPITTSESSKTVEMTGSVKKESMDLDWKPASTVEQTKEAFKETSLPPVAASATPTTPVPHVSNEPPPAEPVSLTIFENPLDIEDKISKTPPISEMESVSTFSSPLPTNHLDMELESTQISGNMDDFVMKDIEENLKNTLNINEVVVTSTFTGSFKETHIYTPPKTNDFEAKSTTATAASTTSSSPTKVSPIDFDYEKAAMGVIINETVVKKEYRDVEYNPPFSMESLGKSVTNKSDMFETNYPNSNTNNILTTTETNAAMDDEQESNDDFSEFQSVPSEVSMPPTKPAAASNTKTLEVPKPTTVSHGGMILSPAILLPQAISLEQQKPKIEWGDSTATINPEELARIEELFPEPKSLKSSNGSNSSQKSTPTHQVASTPSISATVANKELEGNLNDDDDDWSDFVSVTVTNNTSANRLANNNNILAKSPAGSPFKQRSPVVSHRMPPAIHNNSNNDDEWSDFVSSAPPSQPPTSYRVPQFNSGAWQNANFYNNPLSMYHKGPLNVPSAAATTHQTQKSLYNNNNNYNISQQPYQIANNLQPVMLGNNQQQQQQVPNNAYHQQIHVMQNFSTAPVPTPERLSAAANAAKNNQFQSIGSAKVAPSIALIPDLGFVAPAIPTHTSFINSLPKPSINTKK